MALLPNRWQKQPQGPVRIDWSHPLAKGLTGLWIFNTALPINLVNGKKSEVLAGSTTSALLTGNGGKYAYSSIIKHNLVSTQNELFDLTNAVGSMLIVHDGNLSSYAGRRNSGSSQNGTLIADTGIFEFGVRLSASRPTSNKKTVTSALTSGNSGNLKGFQDGVLLGSRSKAASVPSIGAFYVGQIDGVTTSANAKTHAIATWDRELTEKEIRLASDNIYQLLVPMRPMIAAVDPEIFNITGEIDLPFPAPDFTATAQFFDADAITANIDLAAPSVEVSGTAEAGSLVEINLPSPALNIAISGGIFQSASISLSAPSVSMSGSAIGGLIAGLSLDAPIASVSGEVVHGIIGSASLEMAVPEIAIEVAPSLDLDVSVELSGNAVQGAVASASLPIALNVTMGATVEQLNLLALPVGVPVLEAIAVTSGIGEAELPVIVTMSASAMIGQAASIALDIPAPDIDLSLGYEARGSLSLEMPAPYLEASAHMPKPSATYYNRWTR